MKKQKTPSTFRSIERARIKAEKKALGKKKVKITDPDGTKLQNY